MTAASTTKNFPKVRADPRESFPSTVHRMLTEIEDMAIKDSSMAYLQKIISWQKHGMAFKIHDKNKFTNIVMPIYFSRLKYSSFIRQTNLFGFKRINSEGADKGCYFHESFVRDMPEMAATIDKNKKNKKQNEMANELEFQNILSRSQSAPLVGQQSFYQKQLPFSNSLPASPTHSPVPTTSLHAMMKSSSVSEGNMFDMLLPILPTSSNSNSCSFPAFMGGNNKASDDFDPFAHIWGTLEEDNEPLPLSACSSWDDLEPLPMLFP